MMRISRILMSMCLLHSIQLVSFGGWEPDKVTSGLLAQQISVTNVGSGGSVESFGYTAGMIFDYWTKELPDADKYEAQGVVHTFSYSTQDSTGKGGFFNFSYAPSIDLEAQYGWTTDTVDVTMRRYGFELGAYTPWLKQKGLGTMWGLRAAFIDKEFEVVNPVFESEISYWGLFLGISGNHPLGQSSPLSVFWTLQGIALMFNWDGKDREYGYDVEGTSGFGLGTNGTVGFQLAFSDSLTATVGYRGQLLTGDDAYNDDFGDTYQAVIAQMALRF